MPGRALSTTGTYGGAKIELRFPRHPRSVGSARDELRQQLRAWGIGGDAAETAELLLSELITNAVCHAHVSPGREIGTLIALSGDVLRVEVADASSDLPRPRTPTEDDASGRGLLLIAAMAQDWGTSPRDGVGKVVWAELKLEPESAAPGATR